MQQKKKLRKIQMVDQHHMTKKSLNKIKDGDS